MNEKEERMVRESILAAVKEFLLKDETKPLISWRMYMVDGTHVGRTWTKTLEPIEEFLRSYYNFHQEMFGIVVSRLFAISWASRFGSDIKDFGDRYIFIYEEIRPVGMENFNPKAERSQVKPSGTPTADELTWIEEGNVSEKTKHMIKKMLADMTDPTKAETIMNDRLDALRYVTNITKTIPGTDDYKKFEKEFNESIGMKFYSHNEPCAHPGCKSHFSHPCEGCGRILAIGTAWGTSEITNKKEDK